MFDAKPTPWTESELEIVQKEHLFPILSEVAPLLQPAIDTSGGRWDIWAVFRMIESGVSQLWVSRRDNAIEAVAVTTIVPFPRMNVCEIPFVGGRFIDNWLHFEKQIAEWAKARGCQELGGFDTKGGAWVRKLGEPWRRSHIAIRRPL